MDRTKRVSEGKENLEGIFRNARRKDEIEMKETCVFWPSSLGVSLGLTWCVKEAAECDVVVRLIGLASESA